MGLNFTIDMTWGRLILLSLSKIRPKNQSPNTRVAGKCDGASALWPQQHSEDAFFWITYVLLSPGYLLAIKYSRCTSQFTFRRLDFGIIGNFFKTLRNTIWIRRKSIQSSMCIVHRKSWSLREKSSNREDVPSCCFKRVLKVQVFRPENNVRKDVLSYLVVVHPSPPLLCPRVLNVLLGA